MNKLIHISPFDIGLINGLTQFSNAKHVRKYIDPIEYHVAMFSTLYQSGVNYIEIEINTLPPIIRGNEFWKSKIVPWDNQTMKKAYNRAIKVLEGRFNHEIDSKYRVSQFPDVVDYLFKLFYSMESGTPFINPEYIQAKDFTILEPRMDKDLVHCLKNLSKSIVKESINTITPSYSVLKKDVKRFEDIFNTKPYKQYSWLLQQVPYEKKLDLLKKDINVNTIKLVNKYSNNLGVKETAFSFIKLANKAIELFANKIPSSVGDFVINATEKISKEKKRIYFHEVDDAKYSVLLCKRVEEIAKAGKLKYLVDGFKIKK